MSGHRMSLDRCLPFQDYNGNNMGLVKMSSFYKNINSVLSILYFPLLILLALGCSKEKEFVEYLST